MKKMIFFVIFFLMVLLITAFEIHQFSDDIQSQNLTFTTAGSIYKNISISKDANITSAILDLTGFITSNYSFQENATESNFSNNFNDANYSTYITIVDDIPYAMEMNYTKPTSSKGALWQVYGSGKGAIGDFTFYRENITIPDSCWNYDSSKLLFRVDYYVCSRQKVNYSCFNGSWLYLRGGQSDDCGALNTQRLYEEAIFFVFNESFPTNITIKSHNSMAYQNLSEFNGTSTIDLNMTSLQNCITTCSNPSGLNCLCEINFTSTTAGILQISNLNITWNDIKSPRWSNNQTNISTKINDTIQFNVTWTDFNISSSIFSWNCTSTKWNNITTIHQNGENITFVFNETLNYTKDIDNCHWKSYANDTSNNWNETEEWKIEIDKLKPNISVEITPSPILSTDNLSCDIAFQDNEEDTWILNETRWYNGSNLLSDLDNLTVIQYTNTSDGEEWTCQARVKDTFNWSDWKNDSIVIADSTPPNTYNVILERTSMYTDQTNNFSVNVTDVSSNIDWVKFQITKADSTIKNLTAVLDRTGKSVIAWYDFDEVANVGTYNWSFVYAQDTSGNLNTTISNQIFSVSTRPSAQPSGGGGAPPVFPTNVTNVTVEVLAGCNFNSMCESGEDIFSCPSDCKFSVEGLKVFFGRLVIGRILLLVIVLGLIYLYILPKGTLEKYNLPLFWTHKGKSRTKRRWF